MALKDYFDRLAEITGQGVRESDFSNMRSDRNKMKQDFLDQLRLSQQRAVQFNAYAPDDGAGGVSGGMPGGPFSGKFGQYPLHGKLRVSSPYGVNREGHKSAHTGIDWASPAGTPIYAPADATVRSALFNKIYGNQTILDFGGGYSSMFGHQSGFNVKPGQHVKAGQIIGYVGSTGWSTGPHLHFETWINNQPVNPLSWFQ